MRNNTREETGGLFFVVGSVQHEFTDCGNITLFSCFKFSSLRETGEIPWRLRCS